MLYILNLTQITAKKRSFPGVFRGKKYFEKYSGCPDNDTVVCGIIITGKENIDSMNYS